MTSLIFAILLGASSVLAAPPPAGAELSFKIVNSAGRFFQPLATVASKFAGEQLGNSIAHPCLKVIYLGDQFPVQRDFFRVVIKDGFVFRVQHDARGSIVGAMLISPINHQYDYVMDKAGNLFLIDGDNAQTKQRVSCPAVNPPQLIQAMRHSSIEAAAPVATAGEMMIDAEGKISDANLHSGHYGPSETGANLNNLAAELRLHMDAATFVRIRFH